MSTLRFLLALAGVVLFAACGLALMLGFAARAFTIDGLAWVEHGLVGWLFAALLAVLLMRWFVKRLEWKEQ